MSKLTKSWLDKKEQPFDSSMLKVGEMMELHEPEHCAGHIVILTQWGDLRNLCTFDYWNMPKSFKGRKLQPGESVTLTQE